VGWFIGSRIFEIKTQNKEPRLLKLLRTQWTKSFAQNPLQSTPYLRDCTRFLVAPPPLELVGALVITALVTAALVTAALTWQI
jgi:hypothetical protein